MALERQNSSSALSEKLSAAGSLIARLPLAWPTYGGPPTLPAAWGGLAAGRAVGSGGHRLCWRPGWASGLPPLTLPVPLCIHFLHHLLLPLPHQVVLQQLWVPVQESFHLPKVQAWRPSWSQTRLPPPSYTGTKRASAPASSWSCLWLPHQDAGPELLPPAESQGWEAPVPSLRRRLAGSPTPRSCYFCAPHRCPHGAAAAAAARAENPSDRGSRSAWPPPPRLPAPDEWTAVDARWA